MNMLEMVTKMETDSINFYTAAARKTKCPTGKKMFETIADDEKQHLEMINQIIQGLQVTPKDVSPRKNMKSVFEGMKKEMMHKVLVTTDELEAFKIAMQMEKEGADFYRKSLAKATKEKEKALLEQLIKDEQDHYALFSNTYQYLQNTGSWFIWEEGAIHAIVEGG